MDPQQRLLLEVTHEAMEDAGVRRDQLDGTRSSVFIGSFMYDYLCIQAGSEQRDEINPYVAMVGARIAKNPTSIVWAQLEDRWATLVRHSEGILNEHKNGRANSRFERGAAQQIVDLTAAVEPRSIVEATLAIVMMLELEPRLFRSDKGFRTQLVRRVVGLSPNRGQLRFSAKAGKMKRSYQEQSPRVIAILGQWIAETLGATGLTLARLEKADRERATRERQEFQHAVAELR